MRDVEPQRRQRKFRSDLGVRLYGNMRTSCAFRLRTGGTHLRPVQTPKPVRLPLPFPSSRTVPISRRRKRRRAWTRHSAHSFKKIRKLMRHRLPGHSYNNRSSSCSGVRSTFQIAPFGPSTVRARAHPGFAMLMTQTPANGTNDAPLKPIQLKFRSEFATSRFRLKLAWERSWDLEC
jgi:hypothetical protein